MSLFLSLLMKIFPLYLMIILGYLSTRFLHVARESIAPLLIYIIAPVVMFSAGLHVKIDANIMALPLVVFIVSIVLCLVSFNVTKHLWEDGTKNILAFGAGTGNTGYFGIPLAIILFEPNVVNIYIFAVLSFLFYESTLGFYIIARGSYTLKESLIKVLKLPSIYALNLGLFLNYSGIEVSLHVEQFLDYFKGAFAILGMMMIGMGLKGVKEVGMDFKFLSLAFGRKFVVWPLVIFGIIALDKNFFTFFNEDIYKAMFIFAVVPLAANVVAMSVLLKSSPQKASFAVLASTLFSLFSIPLMSMMFL